VRRAFFLQIFFKNPQNCELYGVISALDGVIVEPCGGLMEVLLTVAEVAGIIKLKEQTVRKMALRGELPCRKLGKVVRFSPSEINLWLEKNRKGNTDDLQDGLLQNTNATETPLTNEAIDTTGSLL
jgi:excisionase family DNA binding protein